MELRRRLAENQRGAVRDSRSNLRLNMHSSSSELPPEDQALVPQRIEFVHVEDKRRQALELFHTGVVRPRVRILQLIGPVVVREHGGAVHLDQITIVLDQRRQLLQSPLERPGVRAADIRHNSVHAVDLRDPAFAVGFQGGGDGQVAAAALALQDDFADAQLGFVRGDVLYYGGAVVEAGWEGVAAGGCVGVAVVDED